MKKLIAVILIAIIVLSVATVMVIGENQPDVNPSTTQSTLKDVSAENVVLVENTDDELTMLVANDEGAEVSR